MRTWLEKKTHTKNSTPRTIPAVLLLLHAPGADLNPNAELAAPRPAPPAALPAPSEIWNGGPRAGTGTQEAKRHPRGCPASGTAPVAQSGQQQEPRKVPSRLSPWAAQTPPAPSGAGLAQPAAPGGDANMEGMRDARPHALSGPHRSPRDAPDPLLPSFPQRSQREDRDGSIYKVYI